MAQLINCVKRRETFEKVRYMVDVCGCDVRFRDNAGLTALHWCAVYGREKYEITGHAIIRFLLSRSANLDATDCNGTTPLMLFIQMNCSEELILILVECGADISLRNVHDQTALHYYSMFKKKSIIMCRKLMEKLPDINIKDKYNATPLIYFLMHGCNQEYIDIFLMAGSEVTYTLLDGNCMLHYYAGWSYKNLYQTDGDFHILTRLIGDRKLLNARNSDGTTPLMYFVFYKMPIKMVQFLLNKGADINVCDKRGDTVLHLVFVSLNHLYCEVIKMLLERGANPNSVNVQGDTPLDRALLAGVEEHVNLLYNFGLKRIHKHKFISTYIRQNYPHSKTHQAAIKYILLENETAFNHQLTTEFQYRDIWKSYINDLIEELRRMKVRILVNQVTLFEFLAQPDRRIYSLLLKDCSVNLRTLATEFPLYADVVKSKIEVSNQLSSILYRIRGVSISSRQELGIENHEIGLNFDCFDHLLRFISDQDIRNLLLASVQDRDVS